MSVYKIFILVFNRECMERNVMTSFRILSLFECFLRCFKQDNDFPDNDFRTLVFLFGQSCLCVTFTSWSTPSFGMLLSKFSNRNTHVCTSSIRMISFFTLQCELFTSCNVSNNASLVSAWTGGGRWSTKCGEACTGGGGSQKFPNSCGYLL